MTLPTLIIGSAVRDILWWSVKTLKSIGMLNGGWAIVALDRCVPLHTTGLADSIDSN